jgi:hypothetical protein
MTFGVGYHSWVIATTDEDILLLGDGPDDGSLFLKTSYISELRGVTADLPVVGTLRRSGLINIASAKFVCDNESAVLSSTKPSTYSIFHQLEGDHDLASTIKEAREFVFNFTGIWCCQVAGET